MVRKLSLVEKIKNRILRCWRCDNNITPNFCKKCKKDHYHYRATEKDYLQRCLRE